MILRQLAEQRDRVFPSCPNVGRYFPATTIEDARRRLSRSIERGEGPGVVIGAAGTGKSLLLQLLAAEFRNRFDVVLLGCSQLCGRRALLQAIHFELGLEYHRRDEGQLRLHLLDQLLGADQSVEGLLLLVDEAQSLPTHLIEELRLLTNMVRGGGPAVRLVLAGLPSLEEKLASPELASLSQRLAARCYLGNLTREETTQFVRAQLAASSADPDRLFASDAWPALFEATDGVPRLVNQLCDRTILTATDRNLPQVNRALIQAAWADLQQLPLPFESRTESGGGGGAAAAIIEFGTLDQEEQATDDLREEVDVVIASPVVVEPPGLAEFESAAPPEPDDEEISAEAAESTGSPVDVVTAARATTTTPLRRPRVFRGDVPDAANPFADEFDEEELVLDHLAPLADLFHAHTPLVENRRERSIAQLLDETAPTAAPSVDRPPARVDVDQQGDWNPPPERPAIRLAFPRELVAADVRTVAPLGDGALGAEAGHFGDHAADVLVIDEEPLAVASAPSGALRGNYRNLFSRLRHA